MRQRDIERLGAAAWETVHAINNPREGPKGWWTFAVDRLEEVLTEIDPNGLLRDDAPTAGMDCQDDFVTLRYSPRYIRPADEAGTQE